MFSLFLSLTRLSNSKNASSLIQSVGTWKPVQRYGVPLRNITSTMIWQASGTKKPDESPAPNKTRNHSIYIQCNGISRDWADDIALKIHNSLIDILSRRTDLVITPEQEERLFGGQSAYSIDDWFFKPPNGNDCFDVPRVHYKRTASKSKLVMIRTGLRGWTDAERAELEGAVSKIRGVRDYRTKRMVGTGYRRS